LDLLEDVEGQENALCLLGALTRAADAQVVPVYVLGAPYVTSPKEPMTEIGKAFYALAEKKFKELKDKCDLSALGDLVILESASGTARSLANVTLQFAREQQADVIVMATHGRKGVSRFILGSFAETLALQSQIPIMTVNPSTKVREKISKILFPTNFAPVYRSAFESAVQQAKLHDASLTLFYKEPVYAYPNASPALFYYLEQEAKEREQVSKEWKAWAENLGVRTELVLDNEPGYLEKTACKKAENEDFDLIAMGTQADTVSLIFMGRAARIIMRNAPCPGWVMRS
jgi:nucleotide-binding universal stress UspA family protein